MNQTAKASDIEAVAAAWLERREWANLDASAEHELEAWLSASTAHRVAYIRLVAAWERAERLKALGAGIPAGEVPPRESFGFTRPRVSTGASHDEAPTTPSERLGEAMPGSARTRWQRYGWGAAASVAVVLVGALWYEIVGKWQSYGTPVGTIAPVVLADGSRITLDSNTQVSVDLRSDRRIVQLDRGEALFDVAKDAARPLIVEVGDKHVTAVGTTFSVRRDSNEIHVWVVEGRVKVDAGRDFDQKRAIELDAGAEATTSQGRFVVDRPGLGEIERTLSWRDGFLVFHETPLAVAVEEFNRYRTQKIEIEDRSIDTIMIGGRFRCTDSDGFLELLQKGFPISVTRDATRVSLRRRQPAV